ncbi:alpha/beta hydrolase [Telmatocola sphagniphila]|uniref:Alpha/beta hydrolase n=1 Tax=Telmatocola sphagniphila TaxID=1123043 RepID=A0A8E6B9B8_9BACT|nr:alpha/beta hydrolase [Telmatocola sphagniphila]QVL34575.1 alpha/beta hydrolase [Telmatocola sphagniphila]
MPTATIKERNLQIAYQDLGSGIPLVLLHAFPLDSEMWFYQLEDLSRDFRVIAPDLPGFGNSDDPTSAATVDVTADLIADFLDVIDVKGTINLCGISMGGYIALAFARRQPQRLHTLILVDTKAEADDEKALANRTKMAELAREQGPSAVISTMLPNLLGKSTQEENKMVVDKIQAIGKRQKTSAIVRGLQMLRERPDANPELSRITVPTLVMVGDQDVITPQHCSQNLVDKIELAKLDLIPNAGHLCPVEAPQDFNAAIREFLKRRL